MLVAIFEFLFGPPAPAPAAPPPEEPPAATPPPEKAPAPDPDVLARLASARRRAIIMHGVLCCAPANCDGPAYIRPNREEFELFGAAIGLNSNDYKKEVDIMHTHMFKSDAAGQSKFTVDELRDWLNRQIDEFELIEEFTEFHRKTRILTRKRREKQAAAVRQQQVTTAKGMAAILGAAALVGKAINRPVVPTGPAAARLPVTDENIIT